MGRYIFTIIALAVIFDISELISADRYKGLTRAGVSLLLVLAILTPLPGVIDEMRGALDFSDLESSEGADIRYDAFVSGLREYISSEFDLSREDVEVEAIGFSEVDMRAEKILVTLSGKAALANYKRIESVIDQMGLGEAEVKIEI